MPSESAVAVSMVALAVVLYSALRFVPVSPWVGYAVLFGVGFLGPGLVVSWMRSRTA